MTEPWPEGYIGNRTSAPRPYYPEKDEGATTKPWEYWAEQQRKAVEWFVVEDDNE
jgi:hypothetical protein